MQMTKKCVFVVIPLQDPWPGGMMMGAGGPGAGAGQGLGAGGSKQGKQPNRNVSYSTSEFTLRNLFFLSGQQKEAKCWEEKEEYW